MGSLVGPWQTTISEASRREYRRLLPSFKERRRRRHPPPQRAVPSVVAAPVERPKPSLPRSGPKFLSATGESDSSGDDGPESEEEDDDEGGERKENPLRDRLRDFAIEFRNANDGIEHTKRVGVKTEYTYQDYPSYLNSLVDTMKSWVATVIPDAPDRHVWLSRLCLEVWIQIHSTPARWIDFKKVVYSPPYHVLCVLSEMRCEGGLRIRISDPTDYGTSRRYEAEELETRVAIPFDDQVAAHMPLKRDLSKIFCSVRAVDTTDRLSRDTTQQQTVKRRHNEFQWENKRFSKCQTLLRSCLDDYYRIQVLFTD